MCIEEIKSPKTMNMFYLSQKVECKEKDTMTKCLANKICAWIDNRCVENPRYYL